MKHTDAQLAYALFRITFGVNMAMHGVSRLLSGVGQFAQKTTADFAQTALPSALVWPFAAALPFLELAVGVLLLLGLFTRVALVAGSLLMAALALGTVARGLGHSRHAAPVLARLLPAASAAARQCVQFG